MKSKKKSRIILTKRTVNKQLQLCFKLTTFKFAWIITKNLTTENRWHRSVKKLWVTYLKYNSAENWTLIFSLPFRTNEQGHKFCTKNVFVMNCILFELHYKLTHTIQFRELQRLKPSWQHLLVLSFLLVLSLYSYF